MKRRMRSRGLAAFAGTMVVAGPVLAACVGEPTYEDWAATDGAAGRINLEDVQDAFKRSESVTEFEERVNRIYEGDGVVLIRADKTESGMTLDGFEDLDGNGVNLADYVGGRPALVEFWAIWCELCEALHPQMVEVHARYGDRVGFVAIAVGVAQSQRSVRRHLEDTPAEFPTLWDGRGQAVRAFAAPGTSYIVVLDAEGRVTYTGSGSGQDIEVAVLTGL